MRLLADAEDANKLMLAPVERALAGVRLHPDSQVQDIVIHGVAGLEQLADVTPIDAYEMHRAIAGGRRGRQRSPGLVTTAAVAHRGSTVSAGSDWSSSKSAVS